MATDLRADFKERHHKRLNEAIEVVALLAKRACLEEVHEEPARDVPSMPMPPQDIVGPSSVPTAEKEAGRVLDWALGGATLVEEALDQKDTPASAFPHSWEEMMEMLRWVPCFTNSEPPSTKMSDFFPLTKWISVNLGDEPPIFVSARLPFGRPSLLSPASRNCRTARCRRSWKW